MTKNFVNRKVLFYFNHLLLCLLMIDPLFLLLMTFSIGIIDEKSSFVSDCAVRFVFDCSMQKYVDVYELVKQLFRTRCLTFQNFSIGFHELRYRLQN